MKFLIIRFSSVGDIVLTTPVIRCLKNQLPGVKLHYLVKPVYKMAITNNPHIDKVHLLEDNLNKTVDELKSEQFDYIIDLQRNRFTRRIKSGLKLPAFTLKKLAFRKLLFTKLKWDVM